MQHTLTRYLHADSLSDWPTHSTLLWAGVVLYLAVAGAMVQALVVLSHSRHEIVFDEHVARPEPVAISLAEASATARKCGNAADSPANTLACGTPPGLQHAVLRSQHQEAVVPDTTPVVTSNLLWAPPGSVLLASNGTDDADAPPAARVYALR